MRGAIVGVLCAVTTLACAPPDAADAGVCPADVQLVHGFSMPVTCDTVRFSCDIPAQCRFYPRIRTFVPGACWSLPALSYQYRDFPIDWSPCACVDGNVSCGGRTALGVACLDCPEPDAGR
jgi:hypothetical protein